VFVDSDREAAGAIRANLALTRMDDRATVVRSAVGGFLAARRHGPFDLVLIDPPYVQGAPVGDLQALVAGGLLAAGAWVVLETTGPAAPPPIEGLELVSLRRYGDTTLVFFRPPAEKPGEGR
jgi:16S rRNA (guanine966-N2)-methyltransferase